VLKALPAINAIIDSLFSLPLGEEVGVTIIIITYNAYTVIEEYSVCMCCHSCPGINAIIKYHYNYICR
jgi:hypothetical protein